MMAHFGLQHSQTCFPAAFTDILKYIYILGKQINYIEVLQCAVKASIHFIYDCKSVTRYLFLRAHQQP